jgi:hypothetical protein
LSSHQTNSPSNNSSHRWSENKIFIAIIVTALPAVFGCISFMYSQSETILKKDNEISNLRSRLEIEENKFKNVEKEMAKKEAEVVEARKNNEALQEKLSPEAEFRALKDKFISLGVDLRQCATQSTVEKHNTGRVILRQILNLAAYVKDKHLQSEMLFFVTSMQSNSSTISLCSN